MKVIVTGLIGLVTIVVSFLMLATLGNYKLERNFHDEISSPILALELARSQSDLEAVLGVSAEPATHMAAVQSLHANTMLDLLFIPLYASFLWLFADLFAGKQTALLNLTRVCVVLAAVADYVEDYGMFNAMGAADSGLSDAMALQIRYPSLVKWTFIGIVLFLIAIILLRSSVELYSLATRRLMALAFATSGILILIGTQMHPLIELAMGIFALLFLLNTVGFLGPVVAGWIPGVIPQYVPNFCKQRQAGLVDVGVRPVPVPSGEPPK